VSPVKYELGFYIPGDDNLHSHRRENLKFYTAGLEPISYRGALLSTRVHVSLILSSHNRPSTYQLQRTALLNTRIHVSLIPTSHNRTSTYQLQRIATEHSSTCKSHSHKPQQAYYLSVTEERY
jgi:hypothetical protein